MTGLFLCGKRLLRPALLAGLAACALAAGAMGCGGDLVATGGGIGGSGYVAGPIEELGSIVVGGIRFSIEDAAIVVNGDAGDAGDLSPGMFVGVYGEFDEDGTSGTATRVEFEESVSGPIASVSTDHRRIVVLDQAVVLGELTRLAGVTLDDLLPGLVVTVSGARDADGAIVATFLAARPPARGCRVLGSVEELAGDGSTFRIGDLEIDATGAFVVGGALADGDNVGVLADNCEGSPLRAREIRRLDVIRPPLPGPLRSVRGFVVDARRQDRFRLHVPTVGPVLVLLGQGTVFEGGTAADVSRNDLLRVTGRVDDAGNLRAARVVFLEAAPSPE